MPLLPIGLLIATSVRIYRSMPGSRSVWLGVIAVVWFFVTLASRIAHSSDVKNWALTVPSDATNEAAFAQIELYLAVSSALWFAEQVMFTAFAIALLLLLRRSWGGRGGTQPI